jgi:hypothetical protein
MRKPEQRLWDRMNKAIGKFVFIERVENIVSLGTPDLHVQYNKTHTWVELKQVAKIPARAHTPLLGPAKGLNPNQRNWHLEFSRFGGRSVIVIGVGAREILTIPGTFGDDVNTMSYAALRGLSISNDFDHLMLNLMGIK